MPDADLQSFERRLLLAGIRARHARRIAMELGEHLDDIAAEARANGASADQARSVALDRLGDLDRIASGMLECQDLKAWPYRYPKIARVWLPFAYVTLLPAMPVIAGVQHAQSIARWAACAMAGALITAAMMLLLQLSILFA